MQLALVFPGQGAQYVGMGMDLAEKHPEARAIMKQADEALGFALSDIFINGPDDDLTRTDYSQPAILTVSMMAWTVVKEAVHGLPFMGTAGLSLGEYTALVVAGALSFADAVRLVHLRGKAMQAAANGRAGSMVALVGADEATATRLCQAAAQDQVLRVANLNAPGQVVIAGDRAACERAVTLAKEHQIKRALPLKVAGAFHSPLMAPAAEQLAQALAQVRFQAPRVPVYSNVDAQPVTDPSHIPGRLVAQLTSPVRWADSVVALRRDGADTFWELGPGKTLSGLIPRTVQAVVMANLEKPDELPALVQAVRQGG